MSGTADGRAVPKSTVPAGGTLNRVLGRAFAALCSTLAVSAAAFAPGAAAKPAPKAVFAPITWGACADAPAGFQCGTVEVPRSYTGAPRGTFDIAVTRLPATGPDKQGAVFFNPGGPGGGAIDYLQAAYGQFARLNEHFDLVAFDPRGVGYTTPAVDCRSNQELYGPYAKPFWTPENFDRAAFLKQDQTYIKQCQAANKGVLPYLSTANVARDMDAVRESIGETKLNYVGFSYGTFLGATYAKLFPGNYRSLVLDGAVDPHTYINKPLQSLRQQTAAFEKAFGRFMQACAAHRDHCSFSGDDDPSAWYDDLVDQANASPLANSYDPSRPVTGEDILNGTLTILYSKANWEFLTIALNDYAQTGDAFYLRYLADLTNGRNDDGTYDPGNDRYVAISAAEMKYPSNVNTFIDAGEDCWNSFDHFWVNCGYTEALWGRWPVQAQNAYYGPWNLPKSAQTVLVVGTRYDPATPYRGARRMVDRLGNARLLTMRGDGHTAYGESTCINDAVDTYVERLTLPEPGTVCKQDLDVYPPQQPLQGARSLGGGRLGGLHALATRFAPRAH